MKVETKAENNPCVVKLTVNAAADEIKDEAKKVLNTFVREGVIPGFRKGKVPVAVIQAKFAEEIKQETQGAMFRALYPKAVEEAKLQPVALEGVESVSWVPGESFSFTAVVEVEPAFKLPKYKGLAIKKGDASVTDEQVTEQLESFRKAFAKFEDAKEGDVVADGDFVQMDYVGTLDGQPLAEVVPDQKAVCGAQGFWTQVEEGRFLPEILKALKGMKVGDEKKDVAVKFPKDAAPEPLKGKKVLYAIAVKAIRKCALPDDKAFAEQAKEASFDALRATVRTRLEEQAKQSELAQRRDQAVELLLKKSDFDVPPSFVQRQVEAYVQQLAQQAQYTGVTAEYIEQNRDKILADAKEHAEKQVRLSYILAEIAKAENITVDEKDENKVEGAKARAALDLVLNEAK